MKAIAILLAVLGASPEVEIATVTDETLSGALTKITAEEITLTSEDGSRSVPVSSVLSVRAADPKKTATPAAEATTIRLQGGGSLTCEEMTIKDRNVLATPALGEPIEVPLESVGSLRFRALEAAIADDWKEAAGSAPTRDLLVVRNGDSLDRLEGTISALDADMLTFLVSEQRVAIDRSKPRLFGVVAAHSADASTEPICDVRFRNGDWLSVTSVSFDGGRLSAAAPGGWAAEIPWESVSELDFGRGRIRYLSDLEPRDITHSPYLGGEFDKVFDVRRDRSDAGPETPIRIQNRAYRKGLVIHSHTELLYRLNGQYQRFTATAGIEDLVRPLGSVELVISLDGEEVLRKTITGRDEPIPIELDVSGARELSLTVDFADNWDTADHLALGGARLIK